jgi:hypothetical protein
MRCASLPAPTIPFIIEILPFPEAAVGHIERLSGRIVKTALLFCIP